MLWLYSRVDWWLVFVTYIMNVCVYYGRPKGWKNCLHVPDKVVKLTNQPWLCCQMHEKITLHQCKLSDACINACIYRIYVCIFMLSFWIIHPSVAVKYFYDLKSSWSVKLCGADTLLSTQGCHPALLFSDSKLFRIFNDSTIYSRSFYIAGLTTRCLATHRTKYST